MTFVSVLFGVYYTYSFTGVVMTKLVFILLCFPAFIHGISSQWRPQPDDSEEGWAWGYHPTPQPNNNGHPCAPYDPPVPNFRAPGRRISEVKCYEYVWQLKERDARQKRERACKQMKKAAENKNMLNEIKVQILGGHRTFMEEFPHMAALGWAAVEGQWKFMCGGSLISSNFVLTAAHCASAGRDTTVSDPEPKIVRLGTSNVLKEHSPQLKDVKISKIIVHPEYKPPKPYYDIALMALAEEVKFNLNVQPACLWTRMDLTLENQKVDIAGWGVTRSRDIATSPDLLAAQVDIINNTKCDELLKPSCNRNFCAIQDHQICAGKLEGGVDSCQGDSGGPLCVKIPLPIKTQGSIHYVLGVTSFGIGCGLPNMPGVYVRVSSFINWIEKIVWPKLQ